ncbi:MAG: hypothetical protein JNK58_06230 [Phycisphaerae bacterium]|nr:hypothetical protein [Phycisphaerae bacterium]
MTFPSLRTLAAITTLATMSLPALARDAVTIADLAPKESVFVVGVDDSKAMWDAFDKTGFKSIWDDPTFKKWFEKHSKEAMDNFASELESLGLTLDDLKRPTGPMGLAAWLTGGEEKRNGPDQPPAFIVMADYADDAPEMDEKILAALEKAESKKSVELKEKDHDGVTVHTIRFPADKEARPENDADMDAPGGGLDYPEMHYARVAGALVLSSEIAGIERAIDRLNGDDMPSISDAPEFNDARKQLGETQGYAVALMAPLMKWVKSDAQNMGEGGMEQMLVGMTGALGLDDLRAAGMGLRFDTDHAMMEQSYALLAGRKTGLVALFDAPTMAFDPPPFVSADATSILMMQFNFAGVIPLANQVVAAMPEDMQAMMAQQVSAATMLLGPVLANLGPELCVISNLLRPLNVNSEQQVWAMKMRDANALQQAIAGVMPMTGFESRDFQGNQIWSPAAGGMMPADSVSIGMGFGWMFVGPVKGVEDLLRQGGAADNAKLADEKTFKNATKPLDNKGIAYGFYKIAPALDWYEWYSKNIDKVLAAQAEEAFGNEPPADDEERQWREDAKKSMMDGVPSWMRDPPPMEVIRKFMGDSVLEFKSSADGFEGRTMTLKPGG